MPDDPAQFVQHDGVDVRLWLFAGQGELRSVLSGRCTTPHLRPNGAIVVVRPPFEGARSPLKRLDRVSAHFRRTGGDSLHADGEVSWVRPRAFLPSGLAVSLVGVTFEWDAEEHALEVAAFVSPRDVARH